MIDNVLVATYGMLLDPEVMLEICPEAVEYDKEFGVEAAKILDFKLEFRTHLTIVPSPFDYVPVGLWSVPRECLYMLDQAEGEGVYYERRIIDVWFELNGKIASADAFVYVMLNRETRPQRVAGHGYVENVACGYDHFGLDKYKLIHAVKTAKDKDQSRG